MTDPRATLIDLEHRFWQSMVDGDTNTALDLLSEPSLMVSGHGAMQFDHATYRRMAEKGAMAVRSFQLSDLDVLFPNENTAVVTYHVKQEVAARDGDENTTQEMNDSSTWVKNGHGWKCVMHTETPAEAKAAH
ncbi:MAG TPA: nuclear transport factor 2 family protein [Steroidobacteraceae bacterium]|nr:nuclear transport factor 2 family protein [Steroidobacteraceae bacterium]